MAGSRLTGRVGVPVVVTSEMAVDVWKGRSERAVDRFLARWTDRVVGNSQAVVDFYQQGRHPAGKAHTSSPSGIDDDEPPPEVDPASRSAVSSGLPPRLRPWRSSWVGLAEQKGVADLLSALDLLQHVRPDLRTIIVGDGPLRDRLEATARAFQLVDSTHGVPCFLATGTTSHGFLAASRLCSFLPSLL